MEVKVSADIKALESLTKKYPDASQAARISRITEALFLLEAEIKKNTPVGAGPVHLRDTVFQKVEAGGQSVWGMIGTPAKYGESLEFGSRPHFPPVAPIQHWVEKVLGISGKEAKSVAFLIARAISKRGTKARSMFGKSLEKRQAQILRILEQIPSDITKKMQ
jgi:hypothetical protein